MKRLNRKNNPQKIVVGMSGGVDSSMALVMLKEQGYQPVGVSLKYSVWKDKCNNCKENVCCSKKSFDFAKKICKDLGVEYFQIDVSDSFQKEVIDYFKRELKEKRTPSPCIICNAKLKFAKLLKFADEHKIKYVATGHYANVSYDPKSKKYNLLMAKDKTKDQTYSLSFLNQNQLSRIIFPLGETTKENMYKKAKSLGFGDFYKKNKQSQDFCFVSGSSLPLFLEKEIGIEKGDMVDENGKKLGEHNGLHFFTIGQRKNINLPGGPYYVVDKKIKENILVVSKTPEKFATKQIFLSPYNFISSSPSGKIDVQVKTRSTQTLQKAELGLANKKVIIDFKSPQVSITSGQFAVIYKNDICLGSGRIN
ncbi:MAG: tRNA 2-thiouridine(34) synthase MnmA [Candidatus Berkelbacteria bacterium]|nr:tRNA 2-thiouridine(34) synthase MnmA [Candidatus Berkelbacteria bacterium]